MRACSASSSSSVRRTRAQATRLIDSLAGACGPAQLSSVALRGVRSTSYKCLLADYRSTALLPRLSRFVASARMRRAMRSMLRALLLVGYRPGADAAHDAATPRRPARRARRSRARREVAACHVDHRRSEIRVRTKRAPLTTSRGEAGSARRPQARRARPRTGTRSARVEGAGAGKIAERALQ